MQAIPIVFGLIIAGVVIAIGWLHWRQLVRFGQRGPTWGLGTMALGGLQLIAWILLPGEPERWLRPLVTLTAAVVTAIVLGRRRAP